jgi:hypothetical protein
VELATSFGARQSGSLTLAAISHVFTLKYVAEKLGEDEEWLWDLQIDMDPEDGCLWVHAPVTRASRASPPTASSASNKSLQTKERPAGHHPNSNRQSRIPAVLTACLL